MTNTWLRMLGIGRNASPPRRRNNTKPPVKPTRNLSPLGRPKNLTNEEWRIIQANLASSNNNLTPEERRLIEANIQATLAKQRANASTTRASSNNNLVNLTGNTPTRTPRNRTSNRARSNNNTPRALANAAAYPLVVPRATYIVKLIPGDGDCLFASVAQASRIADGHRPLPRADLIDMANDLRLMTVAYLESHASPDFIDYNPANGAPYNAGTSQHNRFQNYLVTMSKRGVYGTEMEVEALANLVNRNIVVYWDAEAAAQRRARPNRPAPNPSPHLTRWPVIYRPRRGRSRDTIVLLYEQYRRPNGFETGHFDVLLPRRR